MIGLRHFFATPPLFFSAVLNAIASHLAHLGMRIAGLTPEEMEELDK